MTTCKTIPVLTRPALMDFSKHWHWVLIGVAGKTRRRRLTIPNSLEGFMCHGAAFRLCGMPPRIGFEATGDSHGSLAHRLGPTSFLLKMVSLISLAPTYAPQSEYTSF